MAMVVMLMMILMKTTVRMKLTSSNRSSPVTMGQLVTWIGFWEPYMCQSRLLDFMQCFQMCLEKNHKCESHCVIEIY